MLLLYCQLYLISAPFTLMCFRNNFCCPCISVRRSPAYSLVPVIASCVIKHVRNKSLLQRKNLPVTLYMTQAVRIIHTHSRPPLHVIITQPISWDFNDTVPTVLATIVAFPSMGFRTNTLFPCRG